MSFRASHRDFAALFFCILALIALSSARAQGAEKDIYLVPLEPIYPGQPVSQDLIVNVVIKRFRASEAIVSDRRLLEGKVARLPLHAGRPIPLRSIADPPLVKAGKPTAASYVVGNLKIRAIVVVLQDGIVGELVRARNSDSGKVVAGTVQSDGSILVSSP